MAGGDEQSGKRIGKYRIVRPLGRGGMGAVYEALQTDLNRRVALKVLHPHLAQDPQLVTRFRREAMSAAGLGHPNIVQVTDFGRSEEDGSVFLVMELLEGAPLSAVIDRERLPPARLAQVAWQVLSALEAAHAAGIVHRDLKPDNVFLTSVPGVGDVVKLLDFGIAKLAESEGSGLTATGAVLGTPAYMAPEQARGAAVDGRVDVYALGVLMYEALTGRLPYNGANYNAMIAAILTEQPPRIGDLRADLPSDLVAVIERAMERDPASRWQSAGAMREALRPFVGEHASGAAIPMTAAHHATDVGSAATVASTPGMGHPAAVAQTPQPMTPHTNATPPPGSASVGPPRRGGPWAAASLVVAAVTGGALVFAFTRGGELADDRVNAAADGAGAASAGVTAQVRVEPAMAPDAGHEARAETADEDAPSDGVAVAAGERAAAAAERAAARVAERAAARVKRQLERRTQKRSPARRVAYSGCQTDNRYRVQELREAVHRIEGRMNPCYARHDIQNYTWIVDIGPEGRPTGARHAGYELDPPEVQRCMEAALMHLDLGRPPDLGPGEIRVSIAHRRVEDEPPMRR